MQDRGLSIIYKVLPLTNHWVFDQSEVRSDITRTSMCATIVAQINNEPLEIHANELASIYWSSFFQCILYFRHKEMPNLTHQTFDLSMKLEFFFTDVFTDYLYIYINK